jgi:glycosyltransferase involved in cell wall biosynthesis
MWNDGSDRKHPVLLLSVGRAVAKKGYDDLLAALALLPAGLEWRFVHIGGGTLGRALKSQAESLGLSHRIEWRGAFAQPEVLDAYRSADFFVLASKTAKDGDQDGLPNVLIEAQSQRLACVSTNLSAIPELIQHRVTGVLTPPGNPAVLAQALENLIRDPAGRARLGAAGERRVRRLFSMAPGIDALAARFGVLSSLAGEDGADASVLTCALEARP